MVQLMIMMNATVVFYGLAKWFAFIEPMHFKLYLTEMDAFMDLMCYSYIKLLLLLFGTLGKLGLVGEN